ncbi:MAG: hypothetical protein B7Y12_01970 [Rhizobiales bacterium 24-66-13]|nr:MAG: hypothetical protein B7Y12_01970 [Rhizobiales bacterium 24-66-13]OZB11816.1 MAG: hypothetical protein B7X67_01950 [Rhizobiales bacterium 39-66-18]
MEVDIVARKIELVGNLPAVGGREGGPSFRVVFEISDEENKFELVFIVAAPSGVAQALDLAREKLLDFIRAMKAAASEGDLGHGQRRLF